LEVYDKNLNLHSLHTLVELSARISSQDADSEYFTDGIGQ